MRNGRRRSKRRRCPEDPPRRKPLYPRGGKVERIMDMGQKIAEAALPLGRERRLREVIIGLGYTLTYLDDGRCGLAYTLREDLDRGCETFDRSGSLTGRGIEEALSWIGGGEVLASAVGLAAANAVLRPPEDHTDRPLLEALHLRRGELVVTVGRFEPLEPSIEKTGAELRVIEAGMNPDILDLCEVALITATSIINSTLQGLLDRIRKAREVVILGPSTPFAPSAFEGTPVTMLAGSTVSDPGRVRQAVCEGGGTRTMGGALAKWTVGIRSSR